MVCSVFGGAEKGGATDARVPLVECARLFRALVACLGNHHGNCPRPYRQSSVTGTISGVTDKSSESSSNNADWAAQIVDQLESVVNKVKSKTSDPVLSVVRIVFMVFAVAGLGIMTLLLLTIGSVRLANNYLPGDVWVADLVIGLLFLIAGMFVWRMRHPKKP